jgi:hypothetical protein
MDLKQKIDGTRKEEFLQWVGTDARSKRQLISRRMHMSTASGVSLGSEGSVDWWVVREMARMDEGVYCTTEALDWANTQNTSFVHVSLTDPNMVAFTPDKVSGDADRQVTIAPGKYFSRFFPCMTDAWVQAMAAEHLGEVNAEIEWVEGEDIAKIYAKDPGGTAACMSNKGFAVQPTLAYAAPCIRMAVLRGTNGNVTARALTYEEGNKKVYIRAYGDPKLVKRLTLAGYKLGTWVGAKFNTIFLDGAPEGYKRVVIPYLDSQGAGSRADAGSTVGLLDGALTSLSPRQIQAFRLQNFLTAVTSTQGFVDVTPVTSDGFQVPDILQPDQMINTLLTEPESLYSVYDEVTKAVGLTRVAVDQIYTDDTQNELKYVRTVKRDGSGKFWVNRDLCFYYGGSYYMENATNRGDLGFRRLSAKYYPGSDWSRSVSIVEDGDGVEHVVKNEDALVTLVKGEFRHIHKSEVADLKKGWIKLHPVKDNVCYVKKGDDFFLTGKSKRKVHPVWNTDLVITMAGYEFPRNVIGTRSVLNRRLGYTSYVELHSEAFTEFVKTAAFERLEEIFVEAKEDVGLAFINAFYGSNQYTTLMTKPKNRFFVKSISSYDIRAEQPLEYYKEALEGMQTNTTVGDLHFIKQYFTMKLADMLAVEEPIRTPTPVNAQIEELHAELAA